MVRAQRGSRVGISPEFRQNVDGAFRSTPAPRCAQKELHLDGTVTFGCRFAMAHHMPLVDELHEHEFANDCRPRAGPVIAPSM